MCAEQVHTPPSRWLPVVEDTEEFRATTTATTDGHGWRHWRFPPKTPPPCRAGWGRRAKECAIRKEAICGILCLLEHENLQEGSRLSEGNNKISPHTKRSLLPVYICSDLPFVLPGLGDQTEWLLEGKLPVSCPTRWEKQQNRLLAGRNLKYVSSATTAPSWDR